MSSNRANSELQALEQYRVALQNVESQTIIATTMAEFGYDTNVINIGRQLLTECRQAFDTNTKESDEATTAYAAFSKIADAISITYKVHRKKAKVAFRKYPVILSRLMLDGTEPNIYVKWVETMRTLYKNLQSDPGLQSKVALLKLTPAEVTAALATITEMETAREAYLREKGESQDATKTKNATFAKIDEWMSDFYAVARIAMDDKPQLLESIGLFVRS